MSCLTPYYVSNPRYDGSNDAKLPVPCGKCPRCLTRRTSAWSFRLMQEDRAADSGCFVTLTYDNNNVPLSERGFMTLRKEDVQKFLKRLRYFHPKGHNIRYYSAGEYGSNTMRPHYHLIMFNVDQTLIEKAWGLGQIHIGKVSAASVGYTAKYINKGKVVPVHRNDDRIPEFSHMSLGIGKNYLTPQIVAYHKADLSRNYLTLPQGQKVALPRYYRDRLYTDEDRLVQQDMIAVSQGEQIEKERAAYRQVYGTDMGFNAAKQEAIKAEVTNFKNRSKDNRKKV